MRTYKEIAGPKRLVLAHNQDHTAHPYHRLSVDAVSAQQAGRLDEVAPEVEARWLPGTAAASVSVDVPPEAVDAVAVCHSSGSYGPWCARVWRRAEARWDGERWVAEIPVVDPDREVWFYGHADLANGGVSSSPVGRTVPRAHGFATATDAPALRYDFSAERPYDLPIGDPTEPPKRIVEVDGVTGVELTFEEGNYLRGAAPCIEGDMVAAGSYTGVELLVRVEDGSNPDGLAVGVFTDYGTLEEQAYGVPLRGRVTRTGAWERVEFAFHELVWQLHRIYPIGKPRAARPLDLSRCCAIGVLRSDVDYEGTVAFASVRLVPAEDES
jgi:hypothetical protein